MASRIAGITVKIGGDTTELTRALRGVNDSIKTTQTALKDVNKLLNLKPGNADLIKQKQQNLAKAIEETKAKLKTLQETAQSSDLGEDEHNAVQREIIETQEKLKALEAEYRSVDTAASQSLTSAGQKMQSAGEKISDVGKSITGFGKSLSMYVTLPLAGVGTAGVKSFAEVDKTMQLTNKTMGSTAKEAGMLEDAMTDAAANSVYGMQDASTATLNFARAGLSAKQAADALAPAMNLAAGEGGNLDVVSAGLVATINGFHGAFSDAEKYADVFAAACNNSALDVDSLSQAMSVAAPIFASAGYEVQDAALYMGVMANNGIEANKAANSLKTGMARLVSPAKDGAEKMKELGISVTNADGSMKDSVTIQRELHDAFAGLSESEQIAAASAIFGKNQMAPWLALINTAPEDVGKLSGALTNCAETTDEMSEAMMSGFGGSLEKLMSSVDVLKYSLGDALAPIIQKVVDALQWLVDKFNALSPTAQQVIGTIGMIVAAIGPATLIIGGITSGVGKLTQGFGKLLTNLPKIAGAISKVFGILAANPIILVIGLIAGLVAAFVTLWNKSEAFRNFWKGLWDGIKTLVTSVVNGIKSFLSGAWDAISGTVIKVWNGIKNAVSTAVNAVKTTVTNVFNAVKTISGVWNGIKSTVTAALSAVRSKVSDVFNGVKSTVSSVWNGIKNAIITPLTTAKNKVKGIIDAIKGFFNFHFKWPKIPMPHFGISPSGWKIGDLLKGSIPRLSVSWYKEGGIIDGAQIFGKAGGSLLGGGESGKEAVLPLSSFYRELKDIMRSSMESMVNAKDGGTALYTTTNVYIGNREFKSYIEETAVSGVSRHAKNLRKVTG